MKNLSVISENADRTGGGVTKHVFGSNGCFLFIMLHDLSFVCSQIELVEGVTKHVFGSNGCFF